MENLVNELAFHTTSGRHKRSWLPEWLVLASSDATPPSDGVAGKSEENHLLDSICVVGQSHRGSQTNREVASQPGGHEKEDGQFCKLIHSHSAKDSASVRWSVSFGCSSSPSSPSSHSSSMLLFSGSKAPTVAALTEATFTGANFVPRQPSQPRQPLHLRLTWHPSLAWNPGLPDQRQPWHPRQTECKKQTWHRRRPWHEAAWACQEALSAKAASASVASLAA